MAVRLNINGVEYTAENAAEESTLQDILDAMQNQTSATQKQTNTFSKNQKNQTVNTQQTNQALGNFNQAARKSESTLEDLERSADKAGGSLLDTARNVAGGFNSAIKGMISNLEKGEIDPRSMIENVAGAVSTGLSGLGTAAGAAIGSVVPVVGTAAGAAVGKFIGDGLGTTLTTLTGAVGAAIGIMEGFAQTTRTLANEGVVFGEGIGTATQNILDQGLTMSMFTKLVQESGDSLRILGGSATQGSKRLLKMYQSLEANRNQFINLGFAIEDIPGLMADYTASLERFGATTQGMTDTQLRQNTMEYAKNLRLLSDLTGDDVKTLREKKRALQEEAQLQNLIIQQSKIDPNANDKITTAIGLIENLGFTTDEAVKFMNLGVMTGDAALKGQAAGIKEALEEIRTKTLNVDPTVGVTEFTGSLLTTVKENAPKIKQGVEELAQISATTGDRAVALTQGIGKLSTFVNSVDDLNVEEYLKNINKAAETQDKLATGIAELEQSKLDIAKSVQNLATQLTEVSAPVITGAIAKLASAIEISASAITEGIKSISEETPTLSELQTNIINDPTFQNMQVGESLSMNPFSNREIKSQISDFINSLTNAGKTQEEITKELAKIGIERGYGDLTYYKIQPTAPLSNSNTETTEPPRAIPKPNEDIFAPAPPMAYGDIVKPSPGGKIVRVAEAGEAEAILPTERTSSGDLGIKVTGELIDSSYLMKTLVDTNKGGNSLLATLVSKIDNLNGNFEKLVYEQRQANRLAV